jgi:hypothetical protein
MTPTMRYRGGFVAGLLVVSAALQGQQGQQTQSQRAQSPATPAQSAQGQAAQAKSPQAPVQQQLLEIYRIDLVPSGTALALNKPVLQGDVYVFQSWPEKTTVRLPKVRVGKITQKTKDLNQEIVYQVELVPTGRIVSRDEPVFKGNAWLFHTYKGGKLVSMRKSDVLKVTKLTGVAAFRAEQEAMGATMIGDLPMEGGSAQVISTPADAPVGTPPTAPTPPGNWIYQGVPGVTDAYAPAQATVASPGDVPKAPEPTPHPR